MFTLSGKCRSCGTQAEMLLDYDPGDFAGIIAKTIQCEKCTTEAELARKAEEEAERKAKEQREYRRRIEQSGLPEGVWDGEFDKNKLRKPELFDFVFANFTESIILSGPTGIGKTAVLIYFGWKRVQFVDVRFFKLTTLLNRLDELYWDRKTRSQARQLLRELAWCDLLILDDIGKEVLYENEKAAEWLYDMIDERYIHKKKTWVSCNMGAIELINKYGADRGPAIMRRLAHNAAIYKG